MPSVLLKNLQVKGMRMKLKFGVNKITLVSKNRGIHVGWGEGLPASPAPTQPIQLELDFNQSATDSK